MKADLRKKVMEAIKRKIPCLVQYTDGSLMGVIEDKGNNKLVITQISFNADGSIKIMPSIVWCNIEKISSIKEIIIKDIDI